MRKASPCLAAALLLTLGAGCTDSDSSGSDRMPLDGELTFNRHIAPIIFENCAVCHRPGGAGPFSLLTYDDIVTRAKQITMVTASRYMPPWPPRPDRGDFLGQRALTDDQIKALERWVEKGTPRGDPADLPPAPTFRDGWQLGVPDLVLELSEPYVVPADGPDVYRNFIFKVPIERRVFVRTLEVKPDNLAVAHHALLLRDSSRTSRRLDDSSPGPGFGGSDGMELPTSVDSLGGFFNSWTPGKTVFRGYDDMAWPLYPGTDLVLQLHLQPSGKPEKIRPAVGLYLAKRSPERYPVVLCLRSVLIDIPAGERNYTFETAYTLPADVDVLGVLPHAHYVCKEMMGLATLPDGSTRWLIHIEDWDFNWQGDYRYAKPVFLPKGSRLTQRYTYDNSADNPRNPRVPPERVRYGTNSVDEMGELWIQVVPRKSEDRPALVRHFQLWQLENENVRKALKTLETSPDDWSALLDLARTRATQSRLDEALELATRAVRGAPQEAGTHRELAYLSLERGKPEDLESAVKHLLEAIRLRPDYFEAFNDLGRTWMQLGQPGRAAQSFQRAHQIAPDDPVAVYNLGRIALERGDSSMALRLFERTLAIDPSYGPALDAVQKMNARRSGQ